MNGWHDFDYLIASAPGECPFDIDGAANPLRIEMSQRGQWLMMADADALLIAMDDAQGLKPTSHAHLFEFTGNRPNFDDWMAAEHLDIDYEWVDQCAIAFADRASQLSLNNRLGNRVLRIRSLI